MIDPIRPLILDLGCCGLSALQANAWQDDLPPVGEPGQANLLIVAGRLSPALSPFLNVLYQQLARPKWVIAYGTCAASGALFDTIPADHVIPVNICIAGCPPHPDTLRDALTTLARQRRR